MSETAAEILQRYREVRARLRNPAKVVIDRGIDLRRDRYKPSTPPVVNIPIMIVERPKGSPTTRKLALILKMVADFYQIPTNELCGERRVPYFVNARRVYVYLATKHTTASLAAIGRTLRKHHTSIISARKVILRQLDDVKLQEQIFTIESDLYANHP